MGDQSFTYDVEQALNPNSYVRTGYTFTGWNTKEDGTGDSYANEAEVKNLTATKNGSFTLYAQWEINKYNITLPENMEFVPASETSKFDYDSTVSFKAKDGYTASNVKANGTDLTAADGVYTVSVEGDTVITADIKKVYADGIGERLAGHSLSLTGNIGVNFYMELDDAVAADENAYMHFTLPNSNTQDVKIGQASTRNISGKTYYVFQCEVAAKEMTDTITAQMFSGDKSGEVYEYTVKEYADYILANT